MAFGQFFPGLLRNPVHLAALRADLANLHLTSDRCRATYDLG
jgi:hypothetical protein